MNDEISKTRLSRDPSASTATWTKFLAFSTIALVFVTLVGAVVNILQWMEIRRSSIDTKALADYAKDQAKATNVLAEVTKKQAEATALQQRAWIGAASIDLSPLKLGDPIHTAVAYQNFGKETVNVSYWTTTAVYPFDRWGRLLKDDMADNSVDCKSKTADDPSGGRSILFPGTSLTNNNDTDIRVDQDLLDGKRVYARFDCFAYIVGGQVKHTESCYYYINDKKMNVPYFCSAGEFNE